MSEPAARAALITGAARRIGEAITTLLHSRGYAVLIHYRHSAAAAEALQARLNALRPASAWLLQGDLDAPDAPDRLAAAALDCCGRLDLLVNNASGFRPTPLGTATQQDWDELMNSNVRAAFFLSQALAPALRATGGNIVNISDMHASRGLAGYPIYGIAKAGLDMMTRSLARDLAPDVRVNGVAPGAILWPPGMQDVEQERILERIPLQRPGRPDDIAEAVWFLAQAGYITGQTLRVDGGRSLA